MLRKRRKRHSLFLSAFFSVVLLLLWCSVVSAQNVAPQYRKYFVKYTDKRSIAEKVLNKVGLTRADVGRSFALICGVSKYPNMKGKNGKLKPAAEDIRKLQAYLKQYEFFDEIVMLRNEQVTLANLEYFLQTYFPARLKKFPKSRFLFAYSGHGMTENNKGYLLKSTARSLDDKGHAIHVNVLKVYIDEVVAAGHQVLALLNSCHSGTFLKRPYGNVVLLPKYPGAHAITAGGPSELAWHIKEVGSGSIFYEKLLAGISGIADAEKDGIVTGNELYSYLRREIQMVTDQGQNPQMGDISLHGSRGEFFFLNRGTPLVQQKRVKVSGGTAMGEGGSRQDRRIGQYIDHGNGTVTDTKTGLMWKRCSEGLSGVNCEEGEVKKYRYDDAVKRFKHVDYAGYADWRLPTIDEFKALIYCSNGTSSQDAWEKGCNMDYSSEGFKKPTINQQAFPNTVKWGYWSGSLNADNSDGARRYVFFYPGDSLIYNRFYINAVRLVRSGQSPIKLQPLPKAKKLPQKDKTIGQYIDHGNGTVTDTKTGLMWKRCSEGLSGDNCEHGTVVNYTWDGVMQLSKDVAYAGYADWRLPTVDELKTLVYCSKGKDKEGDWCKDGSEKPTINQQAFQNTKAILFWAAHYPGHAWGVDFYNGISGASSNARSYSYSDGNSFNLFGAVRLVRGISKTKTFSSNSKE